jgi:hypothetical protein
MIEAYLGTMLSRSVLLCALIAVCYCLVVTNYVMPNIDDGEMGLGERSRSTMFGDAVSYGRYAEGILKYGYFSDEDGSPMLKHMPGLPLLLAVLFRAFNSLRAFLVLQVVLFFLCLYFFLVRIKTTFATPVLVLTLLTLTFHPLMFRLFNAVMSETLFASLWLWIAFILWKDDPTQKDFVYTGLLFGVASYVREAAFAFVIAVAVAYLIYNRSKYSRRVLYMMCAFLLVLAPWSVRNYLTTHRLIPLTTKSTELFYYYSIPLTSEIYVPFGQKEGYDWQALAKAYDISGKWAFDNRPNMAGYEPNIKDALWNYVSRPKEQFVSMLLKTLALFNKPSFAGRDFDGLAYAFLTIFNVGFYLFHVGVVLFGIFLSFRRRVFGFVYLPYVIIAQYLMALFLWSESRYLMPFYPFLIVLALQWYWEHAPAWVKDALVRLKPTSHFANAG